MYRCFAPRLFFNTALQAEGVFLDACLLMDVLGYLAIIARADMPPDPPKTSSMLPLGRPPDRLECLPGPICRRLLGPRHVRFDGPPG